MPRERPPKWRRDFYATEFVTEVREAGLSQPSRALLEKYEGLTKFSRGHLRRIWRNGGPLPGRKPFEADESIVDRFVDCLGDYKQTHLAYAQDAGGTPKSYHTVYRALRRTLHPRDVAEIRNGARAARAYELSPPREPSQRCELVEVDWVDLGHAVRGPDGEVVLDDNGKPMNLQALVFTDGGTSAIRNVRYAMRRSSSLVLAATLEMAAGLGYDPSFPGQSEAWHDDNDSTFQSDDVNQFLAAFVPSAGNPPPWEPRAKPYVESANGLIKRYYSKNVPGFTGGPGRLDGKLYVPLELSPTLPWARQRLREAVHYINYELRSRRKGRVTRAERWQRSPTTARPIDPAAFREYLPHVKHKVDKPGIYLKDKAYLSAALVKLGGESVDVYVLDAAEPRVYAAFDGDWLGRLYLREDLPPEERRKIEDERRRLAARDSARRHRRLKRAEELVAGMQPTSEDDLAPDLIGRLGAAQEDRERRLLDRYATEHGRSGDDDFIEVVKAP